MIELDLDNNCLDYCGRIDFSDPKKPVFIWPATSLTFRFSGKRAVIKVINHHLNWNNWNNYAGARVDGVVKSFRLNNEGETEIELVNSECDSLHEVIFYKRMDCHEMQLVSLKLSAGSKLLDTEKTAGIDIEVYGDSVSAGEVSEAVDYTGVEDPVHDGHFSNSYYSYAWMTARKLGGRIHDIAQGGIALLDGTGWFHHPKYLGVESCFDKVHYNPDIAPVTRWDFSKYRPHVVIIAIGQNETHPFGDFLKNDPTGELAVRWKKTYKELLLKLRAIYPKSRFILATTIMEHDPAVDRVIDDIATESGDPLLYHFMYSKNGSGTKGHIRISEADAMSDELCFFIRSLNISPDEKM